MRIDEIQKGDWGTFYVHTYNSTYRIQTGDGWGTLERYPLTENAPKLRRDNEAVALLGIRWCRVGDSAVFELSGLNPRATTTRTTSPVIAIDKRYP